MSFTIGLQCPHDSNGTCTCKSQGFMRLSIWTAAEYGLIEAVEYNLKQDFSRLNATDSFGYTPLHYAAQNDKYQIVSRLLKAGANVDLNTCGATPLHRAAASNAIHSCDLLIQAGAQLNIPDTSFGDGKTPFMKAVSNGHVELVKLFLKTEKVNQLLVDSFGKTCWNQTENLQIRNLLSKPIEFSITNSNHLSLLNQIEQTPQVIDLEDGCQEIKMEKPISLLNCFTCSTPSLFMQRIDGNLICSSCAKSILKS